MEPELKPWMDALKDVTARCDLYPVCANHAGLWAEVEREAAAFALRLLEGICQPATEPTSNPSAAFGVAARALNELDRWRKVMEAE